MSWASANRNAAGPYNVVFGGNNRDYVGQSPPLAPGYALNLISTSTNVVRDGICQVPGFVSRFSAVGASPTRMVMVSSTSGGTTSAAELCPIFQALGINNALRLDGGPSTALVVNGVVKNPLTGLYWIKYGDLRRIAYSLDVRW